MAGVANIAKGLLPLIAGGGVLAMPDEAEGAWRPWKPGQPMLPWMDQLWDILERQKFYEPFINSDMLNPEVAERMAKAAFRDSVPGNVHLSQEQLAHIYSRRIFDEGKSPGDVVKLFGRTFGDANAQASPVPGRFPVLTSLQKNKKTGILFPYELVNEDAVLHSAMMKNAAKIRSIREKGTELLEGRRGLHHAHDPSFSLDGNAAYDTQLLRLSDVSNADKEILSKNSEGVNKKHVVPIIGTTGAAAAYYPYTAQAAEQPSKTSSGNPIQNELVSAVHAPEPVTWDDVKHGLSYGTRGVMEGVLGAPACSICFLNRSRDTASPIPARRLRRSMRW